MKKVLLMLISALTFMEMYAFKQQDQLISNQDDRYFIYEGDSANQKQETNRPHKLSEKFVWLPSVAIDGLKYRLDKESREAAVTDNFYVAEGENEDEKEKQLFPDGIMTIPQTVTYEGVEYTVVEMENFYNLKTIKRFDFPATLRNISGVGNHCPLLQEVVIPDGVTETFQSFNDTPELATLYLGASISKIEGFSECPKLENVTLSPDNNNIKMSGLYVLTADGKEIVHDFKYHRVSADDIPEGVEVIGEYSGFFENRYLEKFVAPSTLKVLGNHALDGCSSLTELVLNEGLTGIGAHALGRIGVKELSFPLSVTDIGNLADCPNLEKIYFHKNIRIIGSGDLSHVTQYTIGYNPKLREIVVDPENPWWTSDGKALYNKSKTILGSVVDAGVDVVDFLEPTTLIIGGGALGRNTHSKVIIPENVWKITGQAFMDTQLGEALDIPWRTNDVDKGILYHYSPSSINFHSRIPPVIDDDEIENEEYNRVVLHVPQGAGEVYRNSDGWKSLNIVDDLDPQPYVQYFAGYAGNRRNIQNKGVGTPAGEFAMKLTKEYLNAYKGNKLAAVQFPNAAWCRKAYVFIDNARTGERLLQSEVQLLDVNNFNQIRFEPPFELDGQLNDDLLVGVGKIDSGDMSFSDFKHPEGNYFREAGTSSWNKGMSANYGVWGMWTMIEGTNDVVNVRITSMAVTPTVTDGICHVVAEVQNCGTEIARNLTFKYDFVSNGGTRVGGTVSGTVDVEAEINPLYLGQLEFDIPVTVGGQFNLAVDVVKVNGKDDNVRDTAVSTAAVSVICKSEFSRKVVAELMTATWCPNTPNGYDGVKRMREAYPDSFIGIILHDDDDMTGPFSYFAQLNHYPVFAGVPSAIVDRRENLQVYPDFNSLTTAYQTDIYTATAGVKAEAEFVDDVYGEAVVSVGVDYGPEAEGADYGLKFVVTENGVGPYSQAHNMDISETTLGGSFESMLFNDVARDIKDVDTGLKPTEEHWSNSYRIELPVNVSDWSKAKVVAMLIKGSTGEIVNADEVTFGEFKNIKLESLEFDKKQIELNFGESQSVRVTPVPVNAFVGKIVWESSDPGVATVSSDGVITAVSAGTTVITATAENGVKSECEVTIKTSGIGDVSRSDSSVKVNGNILTAPTGSRVYMADGKFVGICKDDTFVLPAKGVYLVRKGNKTTKIVY